VFAALEEWDSLFVCGLVALPVGVLN
jgi:hypothetical protein